MKLTRDQILTITLHFVYLIAFNIELTSIFFFLPNIFYLAFLLLMLFDGQKIICIHQLGDFLYSSFLIFFLAGQSYEIRMLNRKMAAGTDTSRKCVKVKLFV